MGTPFDRSNAIWAPHAGHPYDATPRCRRGVRHFGHGIGLAVTQAANISCARRSEAAVGETAGAGTERGGGVGAVTADDEGVEVRELATAGASRPQWGQNIPPVPVGSSAIWHDAHFGDAPQDLGSAGVAGVGPDGRGEPGVPAGADGAEGRAQATVPATRSYRIAAPSGFACTSRRTRSVRRGDHERAAERPSTVVGPSDRSVAQTCSR